MATISKITATNAKQIDATNWLAIRDAFGPPEIPTSLARGDCVVQVDTLPKNSADEWAQILWKGGDAISGKANQRRVSRQAEVMTVVSASIGASNQQLALWILWADITVRTQGPLPKGATPWSALTPFAGAQCGAVEVQSITMGKNARGQIVTVATLLPAGVGRVIAAAGQNALFNVRRQLTAHDFADGARQVHKKSFQVWVDDTAKAGQALTSVASDLLFDTDGPDLPMASRSAETYNNFRQWLEWDGQPCSGYASWYFRAHWKNQKVTLNDVGQGSITLPSQPFYK